MAGFVTRAELREIGANTPLTEHAQLRKSLAQRSVSGATFLSHSSKDEDLVIGATKILQAHGGKVYVDEIDPDMPPYTSDETADLLKERIKQSDRFVLLVTKNSKASKWVPWELGVADGYRGLHQIALFPSADDAYDMTWAESEYLGLYRRIAWGGLEGYDEEVWMVLNHKSNSATELRKWLTGG